MQESMRWWTKPVLAVAIYALVAVSLIVAVYTRNEQVMLIIIGAIIAEFARASSFFFGSSDSSQRKDATIDAQGRALATSTPSANPVVTTTKTEAPAGITTTTTAPAEKGRGHDAPHETHGTVPPHR